jgi:hypothetical protein
LAGFQQTAGFSAQVCLEDPVGVTADCEQVLAHVHYALGRNYQQMVYVSGLPGVSRGRTHAFHHWLALDARPFVFPGLVAGGPNSGTGTGRRGRAARPRHSDLGLLGRPRHATRRRDATRGRYTDNDSWATNELDIDWQGVTLYNLYLAPVVGGWRPDEARRFAICTDSPSKGAHEVLSSYRSSSPCGWCGVGFGAGIWIGSHITSPANVPEMSSVASGSAPVAHCSSRPNRSSFSDFSALLMLTPRNLCVVQAQWQIHTTRTAVAGGIFQAAGIALPPNLHQTAA